MARYQYLPLNEFERVQLLKTILIPRWTYRTLFIPNDSMFKATDSMYLRFVLMAKGMELNKVDVHKSYNVLHVTSPQLPGQNGVANCSGPASSQWYRTHYAHVRDPLAASSTKNYPPEQCLSATT